MVREKISGILAFGDSVIRGVTLLNGTYSICPSRFTNLLSERLQLPIINKGHMGHTVINLEKSLSYVTELLQDPAFNTVFLEYGGNDCDFDWRAVSENPSGTYCSKTSPDSFRAEYARQIARLTAAGKRVFLLSLPPIDANRYFNWISKNLNPENILKWLQGDIFHLMHWHESFNLMVYQIGTTAGVPVLDITSPFLTTKNYSRYLSEDGIHPNEEGHWLIAEALLPQLLCYTG